MINASGNDRYGMSEEQMAEEASALAGQIHAAYLPSYLQESWVRGKGKWYEEWERDQLEVLVMSEVCDDPVRLGELEAHKEYVALIFGIFGAAFRILDHVGMHLRGQTFGQYELLPEDEGLLRDLCQRVLTAKEPDFSPFFPMAPEEDS